MSLNVGKYEQFQTNPFLKVITGSPAVQAPGVKPVNFKTQAYAAIPYERAPQQGDTVPTVDKNGQPLLPGYEPAGRVFDSNKWLGL